jgi:hypothetical protein
LSGDNVDEMFHSIFRHIYNDYMGNRFGAMDEKESLITKKSLEERPHGGSFVLGNKTKAGGCGC